ncbi:uncharacterized protein LOC143230841 isoform X2 [Tachypleus tridentatus]|uniref:uncharacterized protein LOC143230841 isoform X2 n=1 Tax=Tachypleus tridentatus TaxID=6853 RepID=UPI003FD4BE51
MTTFDEKCLNSTLLQVIPEKEELFSWDNIYYQDQDDPRTAHIDGEMITYGVEDPNLIMLYVHKQSDCLSDLADYDEFGGYRFLETIEEETSEDLKSQSDEIWSLSYGESKTNSSSDLNYDHTLLDLSCKDRNVSKPNRKDVVEIVDIPLSQKKTCLYSGYQNHEQQWGLSPACQSVQQRIREGSDDDRTVKLNCISSTSITGQSEDEDESVSDMSDDDGSDLSEFSSLERAVLAEFSFEDIENHENTLGAHSSTDAMMNLNYLHLFQNNDPHEATSSVKERDQIDRETEDDDNNLFLGPDNKTTFSKTAVTNSLVCVPDYSATVKKQSCETLSDNLRTCANNHERVLQNYNHKLPSDKTRNCRSKTFISASSDGKELNSRRLGSPELLKKESFSHYRKNAKQVNYSNDSNFARSLEGFLILEGREVSAGEYCDWWNHEFFTEDCFDIKLQNSLCQIEDNDNLLHFEKYKDVLDVQQIKSNQESKNVTEGIRFLDSDVTFECTNEGCFSDAREYFAKMIFTNVVNERNPDTSVSVPEQDVCLKDEVKKIHDVKLIEQNDEGKRCKTYSSNKEPKDYVKNKVFQSEYDNCSKIIKMSVNNSFSQVRKDQENLNLNTTDPERKVVSYDCDSGTVTDLALNPCDTPVSGATSCLRELFSMHKNDKKLCVHSEARAIENAPGNRCLPFQEVLLRQTSTDGLLIEQTTQAPYKERFIDHTCNVHENDTEFSVEVAWGRNVGFSDQQRSYEQDDSNIKFTVTDIHQRVDKWSTDRAFSYASLTDGRAKSCGIDSQKTDTCSTETRSVPECLLHSKNLKVSGEEFSSNNVPPSNCSQQSTSLQVEQWMKPYQIKSYGPSSKFLSEQENTELNDILTFENNNDTKGKNDITESVICRAFGESEIISNQSKKSKNKTRRISETMERSAIENTKIGESHRVDNEETTQDESKYEEQGLHPLSMLLERGRHDSENPKIESFRHLNPLQYDQRIDDEESKCLRTEKQDKIRSSEHQLISPIECTTMSSQQEREETRNVCSPLDVSVRSDRSVNQNSVSVGDTLFKRKHVLASCVTFTPHYEEKEYGGMSSKLLLGISDQETNHNSKNTNTRCNNSALRDDEKPKELSQGSVESQSLTSDDHRYHHTKKYLRNPHLYLSETGSAFKTFIDGCHIDRKKLNYVDSESIQSHRLLGDEGKQRKRDDLTIVPSEVSREVAQYVAPSRAIHDNYKINLEDVSEGVETRSLQYQSDLHDPTSVECESEPLLRDFPPLARNAWSSEELVSDRVENSTDVFLNLGRLCAAEREDLEPSPVEGKPGKYTPVAKGARPTSRTLRKSTRDESNDWKKCDYPLTRTITSCSKTSSSQRDCLVDKVTTDAKTVSTSTSVETDKPRQSLTRVAPRGVTCANVPSHILIKNNLLAYSLPDISNVVFTVNSKTEELCGSSCQKVTKLRNASFDDSFLVISNFHCFKYLRRSLSEPVLPFQTPCGCANPSKGDVNTKQGISREFVKEKKGNNLKHLQYSSNNMTDKYLCSDTDNVGRDCSFGETPSKSIKDNQLQIKQPKYREFSSLKMANVAKPIEREEELAQEPILVGRQVLQVHASVIPSFTKSTVKLPSGLTKPEPPPKPAHLLTIGKARQVRPPDLVTEGSSFKHSGLIPINTDSTVTLAGVNNRLLLPSNINKTSDVTTWKYGGEVGRPKAVTIVIPTDKGELDNVNIVSLTCEPENKCVMVNETELTNLNFVAPQEKPKPPCNERSAIKIHSQTRRSKEDENKLSCLENRYGRSVTPEYPSLIHAEKKLSFPLSSHNYISDSLTSAHPKIQGRQGFNGSKNKVERNFNSSLKLKPVAECQKPRNIASLSLLSSPSTQEGSADRIERITGFKSATKGNATKPPLPPHLQNVECDRLHSGIRGRIAVARKQFLDSVQINEGIVSDNVSQDLNKERFKSFRRSTEVERARLRGSTPDLVALERSARSSRRHIDRILASKGPNQQESSAERNSSESHRHTGDPNVAWPSYKEKLAQYKERCELEKTLRRRSKSLGYLETDIDTLECRQVCETDIDSSSQKNNTDNESHARSMLTLGDQDQIHFTSGMEDNSRARSMDFLLDDDNRLAALPPENTLNTNKPKSEHELRIERSLQNLNLPEWYRSSPWSKRSQERIILKRSEGAQRPRWEGLGSRTPSSSSLASTSFSGRNLTTPDRMNNADWRCMGSFRSSRESLTGVGTDSASPADSWSRWSSPRLSSAPVSGLSGYRSFRQPYLGWRAAASLSPSSNLSRAPSPAPSTPLTTSRPVSPGRILGEGYIASRHLMDESKTQSSPHVQTVKNLEKSNFLTNYNERLSQYSYSPDVMEQTNHNSRPEQAPPPTNHPTGDTEARNSRNGSFEEASLSSSYIRKVSQNYSESTDSNSLHHHQLRSADENDSLFQSSLIRLYDSLAKSSEPICASTSVSDPSSSLYQGFITDNSIRKNSYKEYSKHKHSQEKDISLSQQIPINHNSLWKCSVNNETDHSESAYLNEKEKNENLKVVTTHFGPQAVSSGLQQENDDPQVVSSIPQQENYDSQVVSSRLHQENDDPQVVSSRLHQENDDSQVVSSRLHQENDDPQVVSSRLHQENDDHQVVSSRLHQENDDPQVVSSILHQENDDPQVVSSKLHQENDDPQVVNIRLPQENSEKRKNDLNGYREESEMTLEELDTFTPSFNQNVHDKFESLREGNREDDTFSYIQIQSICSGGSIVHKESEKDTSPSEPHSSSYTDQNQSSFSPEHVMWMESSFVGSRPTTSVVVMPSGVSPAKTNNDTCDMDGDKDNVQNGQNNLEEETKDVTTSQDDVLDSLLAIPFSSLSSSPGASRHCSPSVTQMISSVTVGQEVSVAFDIGCTEPHQKSFTDMASHLTTFSRSRAGFQESPCRKITEEVSHKSGTGDDNVSSSTVATSLEPDFEQSSKENAEKNLNEAMSKENNKCTSPEQANPYRAIC